MTIVHLKPEIDAALTRFGFAARSCALLSPLGEKKGRRCAYRVEDAHGRILKARLFESPEEARRVYRLRQGLEPAFAPALACDGAVIIEEWIAGVALADVARTDWIEPAGALLGRLHARPLDATEPATLSSRRWLDGAHADLDLLTAAGTIEADDAERLRDELRRRDPEICRSVLIHTDFCSDNMVIDERGRLRVIDNEGLAVRPAGFDLARTFQLWPMSTRDRARFRRGYLSAAPEEPAAPGFWRIVAVLMGARIFLKLSPEKLDAAVALLRRFVAGEQLEDAGE